MYRRILAVALLLAGFWCLGQQEGRSQFIGSGVWKTPGGGAVCVLPTFSGALAGHWIADTGITQSGGTVSAWADTTAGISLAQATGANQPVYLATGYNGKPALELFGSMGTGHQSSWMTTSANAVALAPSGAFSWFVVGQLLTNTDAIGFGRFLSYANGATNDNTTTATNLARDGTTAQLDVGLGTSSFFQQTVSLATNLRLGVVNDSLTTANSYVNNVAGSAISTTQITAATGTFQIGGNLATPTVWIDAIEREIVLYNIALNGTQLNTLDTYLTCINGV